MRSYPAKKGRGAEKFSAKVSADDLDEYEVAIYLMEHNDVDEVKVITGLHSFKATGVVFFSGKPHPFSVSLTKR